MYRRLREIILRWGRTIIIWSSTRIVITETDVPEGRRGGCRDFEAVPRYLRRKEGVRLYEEMPAIAARLVVLSYVQSYFSLSLFQLFTFLFWR